MKQIVKLLLTGLILAGTPALIKAQVPQKFNYQGIARDSKGNPMGKQTLGIKLSVLPTSDATTPEYEEVQTITTNEFGLYTLQIGNGQAVTGTMAEVKWETGNKYIRVSIDPKGGSNYVDAGTTQLLSVPYAIYADKAGMAKETAGGTRAGTVSTSAAGTGTVNYLTKFTAANTIYNSQVFDNGTNIGIGTTTPSAKVHVNQNVAAVQEHIRMQNQSATGAGRFTMYSDAATNYATFTKYGSTFAGGYAGITTLYPYANLLAFGNNGVAANDGLGRFLISTAGNAGISLFKGGTSKLKFHADFTTENVGIGGNSAPVSRVHLNNTDGTSMDVRLTNNTSGHTANDGLTITENGTTASINNLENGDLNFGTNNTTRMTVTAAGNVEVANQLKIAGGAPGAGKILTSDATGLASWNTPTISSAGGTLNYIPKYTPDGSTLGNSNLLDNGTDLLWKTTIPNTNINGVSSQTDFTFRGDKYAVVINKNSSGENQVILTNPILNILLMGDSTRMQTALYDSTSAICDYLSNTHIGTVNNGLNIRYGSGKIFNGSINQGPFSNAHFAISANHDTTAHFISTNSNGTSNLGVLTQVTSDYSPIGHQINTTRTGTGNPSFSYGQTITVNGNEQDAYGSNIYVTNANSAGGFTTGEFIQSVQNGNANNYGQQIVASTNSASSTNTTIGSWVSANAPNSNQGRVTAIIGSAVGGDVQVIGIQGNATGKWDATNGTTDAFGVFGQAFGGFGNADYAYSIYGASATGALTNYAGYFNGNTHINGTLSKSSGTFKIDHPQDPENKYLIHSFVESPDMMNVYNGNIITDNDGNATIELPAYFEAENKDFKYQLTVIDNSNDFVMAKVTEKVFNNTFKIKTSKPNVEVSWQVTGVRQDAWANAHRVVPEVEKGEREKGKYLNPEVFGKDASYALNPQPQDAKDTMSEKEKSAEEARKKEIAEMPAHAQELLEKQKQQELDKKNRTGNPNGSVLGN